MNLDFNFWVSSQITDFSESDLIKEFSDVQFNVIRERLFRLFQHNTLESTNGGKKQRYISSYNDFIDFFGLPYTSSSDFACLTVTNSEYIIGINIYEQPISLAYFAIDTKNRIIAIGKDADEYYTYYNLGLFYDFGRE